MVNKKRVAPLPGEHSCDINGNCEWRYKSIRTNFDDVYKDISKMLHETQLDVQSISIGYIKEKGYFEAIVQYFDYSKAVQTTHEVDITTEIDAMSEISIEDAWLSTNEDRLSISGGIYGADSNISINGVQFNTKKSLIDRLNDIDNNSTVKVNLTRIQDAGSTEHIKNLSFVMTGKEFKDAIPELIRNNE